MNTRDVVLVAASTFLIIIGAYISVPIGPVPIVLTNFFIILIGLLFGWKKALLAILTYIILGAVGLPLFSNGKAGIAHLTGLTGGFIFGFIPLAFLSGLCSSKKIITKVTVVLMASVLIYLIGVPWAQYIFNNVVAPKNNYPLWDLATTLQKCAIPFLIPDVLKIVAAVVISEAITPVLKPFISPEND